MVEEMDDAAGQLVRRRSRIQKIRYDTIWTILLRDRQGGAVWKEGMKDC